MKILNCIRAVAEPALIVVLIWGCSYAKAGEFVEHAGSEISHDARSGEVGAGAAPENASNPLAKVKNTDIRWDYIDASSGGTNDFYIDGAFMATDKLKIKYELHYWDTDVTGSRHSGWESMLLKGIYFPVEGAWGDVKYRMALGLDWIIDLGDEDKGIGIGSDQLAPFGGIALALPSKTTLIPLVQQFADYSGNDVNSTAFRLIALQPLPSDAWLKLDVIAPFDWEDDGAVRGISEIQLGKNINQNLAVYVDGLAGFGGGKTFDWGVGVGLRFKY